jgi:adenylosuccinate lyase
MCGIVANLRVDEQRMLKNMEVTQGRMMSEAVMIMLTRKGMNRQEAHEHLRKLAMKSETESRHFRQILLEDKTVSKLLSEEEIDEALNPKNYLGTALKQVDLAINRTSAELDA